METIIEIVLPILAALATAGVGALLAWINAKWNFDLPPELMTAITSAARHSILTVENQARNTIGQWTSEMKKNAVLQSLDYYAARHPEAKKWLKRKGSAFVESLLSSDLTPPEVTPKPVKK